MAPIEWNPTKEVVSIDGNEPIAAAAQKMKEHGVHHLVVIDSGGKATGIVGEGELLNALLQGETASTMLQGHARSLDTSLEESSSLENAVKLFCDEKLTASVVLREGKPVGIVTQSDLIQVMRAILGEKPEIGLLESSEAALADSPITRSLIKMLSDLGI